MVETARPGVDAASRRDATLDALAFAAQRFLEQTAWESVVPEVLRRLGEATAADRAYVFENHGEDGRLSTTRRSEWTAPGVGPQRAADGATATFDGSDRWAQVLGAREVVCGPVAGLPASERRHLEHEGVRSILVVPIFTGDEWWGSVEFDDCSTEREWAPVEVDALRAVAGILGAAIQRRRNEHRLEEAEVRYRTIVERTPAVTYLEHPTEDYEAASSIIYMSPQIEQILGYPAQHWSTIPGFWTTVVHPDDRERVVAESDRTSMTGQPYSQEYRMVAADGRVRWFHDESMLLHDEAGAPQVWQGVMLDVTERKHAEEQLRKAERDFRALVEHLPAVVYRETLDARPGDFYISPQVTAMFGYTPDEWTWTPDFWIDRIHPNDRERVQTEDDRMTTTREPFLSEYRFRRADGTYVWIHDEATLVEDPDREPFWQGFMLDVSERKRAEHALQEAEALYRTLVEQVPLVIYTQAIDPDDPTRTNTIYISPRTEELIGYSVEETLAMGGGLWREILHPNDRERVLAEDAQGNVTGAPFAMEYRMVAKGDRVVWIRDEATVVRDADGRPRFWQGYMLDITERKEAEEQLERALAVEREATQRLRALDEMKNTFLQAVSHDLRTPLAAILGLAVTLAREDVDLDPTEARDLALRIAGNARKLDRMVADLLDLDRLARGIVEPKLHTTDVGALVRRVASESDLTAEGRIQVEAPPVEVSVDASKVERIVENLLSNTARHTPEGTQVWVRVEPARSGVLVVVEDDGPGIPAPLREAVFEPFRQGPDAPRHAPGVGVGLSLVARFAELMGGRAWVQERVGGGASFRVFLADGGRGS